MKPITRRGLLQERMALYERLAEVDAALKRVRLRWDAAEARRRRAVQAAYALRDLAHGWREQRDQARAERDAARTEVAVLVEIVDDIRGRCAEARAMHEDCDDPQCEARVTLADELLKTIGDPDETEASKETVDG